MHESSFCSLSKILRNGRHPYNLNLLLLLLISRCISRVNGLAWRKHCTDISKMPSELWGPFWGPDSSQCNATTMHPSDTQDGWMDFDYAFSLLFLVSCLEFQVAAWVTLWHSTSLHNMHVIFRQTCIIFAIRSQSNFTKNNVLTWSIFSTGTNFSLPIFETGFPPSQRLALNRIWNEKITANAWVRQFSIRPHRRQAAACRRQRFLTIEEFEPKIGLRVFVELFLVTWLSK